MSSIKTWRTILLAALIVPVAQGAVEIRVDTKTDSESKYKRIDRQRKLAMIHYSRRLAVTVKNLGSKKLEQVVVKYYVFARDVGMNTIEAVGMGQQTLDVGAMKAESFETQPVWLTHRVYDDAGGKFAGHVVQVFQGQTLLRELYEPKDMRDKFVKATASAEETVSRWQAAEKKLRRKPKD